MMSVENATSEDGVDFPSLAAESSGQDVSGLFDRSDTSRFFPACADLSSMEPFLNADLCAANSTGSSSDNNGCQLQAPTEDFLNSLDISNSTKQVGYSWQQVSDVPGHLVLDGIVLNLAPYLEDVSDPVDSSPVDRAIRTILAEDELHGRDATKMFKTSSDLSKTIPCMKQRYAAGRIDKITPGCFVSQLFLYVSLTVILGIVIARFVMACVFSWFISKRLCKPPKNLKRNVVSPAVLPEGANIQVGNMTGTAPWVQAEHQQSRREKANKINKANGMLSPTDEKGPADRNRALPVDANGMIRMGAIGAELFTVCLVTCYSEGRDGIKATLDSISAADFSDARKLLFIVCDGIITGSGEKMSTPDICVDLMERDERFGAGEPAAMSFLSVASGSKAYNEAKVYAGHYSAFPARFTTSLKPLSNFTSRHS